MTRLPQPDLEHILRHTEGLWEDLRGQSVFLTGGSGFVGGWLLESLLHANDRLSLGASAVVLTRDPKRFRARSPHLAAHAAVTLVEGDIVDFAYPAGRFPFVIHAATEQPIEPDAAHPLGAFPRDVDGTRRVLEFARTHGVRRLLFTSSGAVYGRQPPDLAHVPDDHASAPATTDTRSAYGQAKRVSEFMCAMYGRVYGFDAMVARLFAFVGPLLPLDAHYAVGNFIRDARGGGPVRISSDGTPRRSYLYAADLGIWLWKILLRGKSGHPYNVGSPHDLSIADLARIVAGAIAPGVVIETAMNPTPGAPPHRYVPRTDRAAAELGLSPLITLDEGVRRTSEWHGKGNVQ